jgi:hypothetical protein
VLRIWNVYPGYEFFHPGSKIQGQKDSGSASKNIYIFNPKIITKLSEKLSGMFIPDLDLDF